MQGGDESVAVAERVIDDIRSMSSKGYNLNPDDLRYALQSTNTQGEYRSLKDIFLDTIPVSSKKRFIIPKTETQREYIEAIKSERATFRRLQLNLRTYLPNENGTVVDITCSRIKLINHIVFILLNFNFNNACTGVAHGLIARR